MEFNYILKNEDFNIQKILQSGQNLFYQEENKIFSFYFKTDQIFSYTENDVSYFSIDEVYFNNNLYNFFDLQTDYRKIRNEINEKFPELKKYTDFGKGIRFISQDFLEVAITFIISQNNNIKRILNSINLLKKFGNGIFPDLSTLKKLTISDFRSIGVGFRDKYLYNFIQNIDDEWINEIKSMNTQDAFNNLNSFLGIGPKVANCILLFGLNKRNVFPVDTHIKKIMQELYFENNDINVKDIEHFALNKFGLLSSYIQQYLFYWQISNK